MGVVAGAPHAPVAGAEVQAVGPEPGGAVGAMGATGAIGAEGAAPGGVPRATGEFVQGEAPAVGVGAVGAGASPGVSAEASPGVRVGAAPGVAVDEGAPQRGTAAVVAGDSGGSAMIDGEAVEGEDAVDADDALERDARERRERRDDVRVVSEGLTDAI